MTTFRSPNVPYDTASHDSLSDVSSTATIKPIPRHRLLPAEDATYPLAAWSNTERDLEVIDEQKKSIEIHLEGPKSAIMLALIASLQ